MTTTDKPVRRETLSLHRGRPLVVSLELCTVRIRQKGRRHFYEVPYAAIFDLGAKLAARQAAEEKREQRNRRKGKR